MPTSSECLLHLSPYHPFTPRQKDVLLSIANGFSREATAEALGMSPGTIKHHISGKVKPSEVPDHQKGTGKFGIFGTMEILCGERPLSMTQCVVRLIHDGVLLFDEKPPDLFSDSSSDGK